MLNFTPYIIDYIVFSLVTSNVDGFRKNWQWLTYDGVKWFVTPYDLDCTFGNIWTGKLLLPAAWSWPGVDYKSYTSSGPCYWVSTYFLSEIKERYETLRSNGVFTPEHIMQYVYDWYNRVGADSYAAEMEKWANSYCYNELVCNPNWTTTDDWTGYSAITAYNSNTTYQKGDKCTLDYKIWIATGETTGVKPYSKLGYTDNASRVQKWISDRLSLEDTYLSYSAPLQESYDLVVSSVGKATLCVPFTFDIPSGIQLYTVTGVDDNNNLINERVSTPVANKPYLVVGTPGTYTLSGSYDAGDPSAEDYMSNGLLWGTYSVVYVPQGGYVLQTNDNEHASFALVTKSDYISIGANKAYLEVPPTGIAKALIMVLDPNTATAVSCISPSNNDLEIEIITNISGIKLPRLQNGINIVKYNDGTTKKIIR